MTDRLSLLVVAHGSTSDTRTRSPALEHADALRRTDPFDDVSGALVKGTPTIPDRLQSVPAGRLVVVPLFVSDGYFAGDVVPETVERARPEDVSVTYAPAVGVNEQVSTVIRRRASEAVGDRRDDVALALVGHGSARSDANASVVREHADRVRERDEFAAVRSFFLEEPPGIDQVRAEVDAAETVVVPVFIAAGHHVREDIPAQLGLEGGDTTGDSALHYTEPVGTHPMIADIVYDHAIASLDGTTPSRSADIHDETTLVNRTGGNSP